MVVEGQHNRLWPRLQPINIQRLAVLFDDQQLQQIVHLRRQLAETVDQLHRHRLHLRRGGQIRQAAIDLQAQIQIANIVLWDKQGGIADLNGGRPILTLRLGCCPIAAARCTARLNRCHRVGQHLLIQLNPHLTDLPRLFIAQQVARTANIQIMAGQLEPRAQLIQPRHHLQPTGGGFGHHLPRRQGQIGMAAHLAPPYPPAQLVQLRQAETIGTVDDDGVGVRNIQPRFNNMSTQQQVGAPIQELLHHRLQIARA